MQRLFFALFLALFLHLLFFLLPFHRKIDRLPQITGDKTIRIDLTMPAAPAQQQRVAVQEKKAEEKRAVKTITKDKKEYTPIAITATGRKKHIKQIQVNRDKTGTADAPDPAPTTRQPTQATTQASTPATTVKARPLYHKNPQPVYPAIARRRNWQGITILLVNVSENGEVKRVRVHTGSGHEILDKSALKSVKSWRFLPGTENGKTTEMEVLVPVHFKLQ